jgi:shikimate dehydrogenase
MNGGSEIFGIVGNPLGHSLSPLMHEAAYKAMGMAARFELFETYDLTRTLKAIRERGIRGVSVTLPYKREIIPLLDECDEDASRIGAVNTVTNESGRLRGSNTDWSGLAEDLRVRVDLSGREVAILGAGGAARAALYAVMRLGGRPVIVNRTCLLGKGLAAELGCGFIPLADIGACTADGLIQTTPVGMWPRVDASPVSAGVLHRFRWVAECIYNPPRTRLLREAEKEGCETFDGVGMFVNQGAEQIRIWTGRQAPRDLMRRVVLERLSTNDQATSDQ